MPRADGDGECRDGQHPRQDDHRHKAYEHIGKEDALHRGKPVPHGRLFLHRVRPPSPAGACGPPQTNHFKTAAPVYQNTRRLKSVPPVLPVGKKQAAKPFSSACASFFDKIAKLEIAAPARQNMPQKPRFFKKAHGFKFGSLQTRPGAVMLKAQPRTAFPPDTGQNGNM